MDMRHLMIKSRLAVAVPAGIAALGFSATVAATAVVGNGIYDVGVAEIGDSTIGSWAAATAAGHPTGAGNDLIFVENGGTFGTGTNFSSLRVYNPTGGTTDYTFGSNGGTNMDSFATSDGASPLGTGQRTNWSVTPESLDITQDVIVSGTTFSDSAIYHTVEITNTASTGSVQVGWRNLYDWQVDDPSTDDGPNNSIETTSGVVVAATTLEFSHTPAAGEFARVSIDPGVPTYEPLLALGYDPGFIASLPVTTPEEYAYVSWPASFGTAFDYTPAGSNVTSDSAGLSWFGRTANTAIEIQAGQSVRLTQILFGVPEGDTPPDGEVPVPGVLALFGIGLIGLLPWIRRRQRNF